MTKTIRLYKDKVRIEFEEEKHLYKVFDAQGDFHVPLSVTKATSIIDKSGPLMNWAVKLMREDLLVVLKETPAELTADRIISASNLHRAKKKEAADIGTAIHNWVEQHIKGLKPSMPEESGILNGVIAYLKWVEEKGVKFLASEQIVYSRKHDYVGMMDCKFTLREEGHKIIHAGDFKSGGYYDDHRLQVAAYQAADMEEAKTKYGDKYLIRFDKNTGEFSHKSFGYQKKDFEAFLSCLNLRRRMIELKEESK